MKFGLKCNWKGSGHFRSHQVSPTTVVLLWDCLYPADTPLLSKSWVKVNGEAPELVLETGFALEKHGVSSWSCESIRLSSVMQWSLRNRLQSHKNRGNPEKIQKTDEPPSNSAVQHHERKRMGLFGLGNNVIFQRQMDNTALVPLLGLLCRLISKICLCPPSKSLWRWLNAACPSLATAMETARDIPRWKSRESPVTWLYRLDQGLWFSASHTCHQLVPVAQHHKKPHLCQEDDYFLNSDFIAFWIHFPSWKIQPDAS